MPKKIQVIHTVEKLREIRRSWGFQEKVGFVPTMGALHNGHGSLIARAAAENAHTIVSVFVNPTQFGANEDLDKYPRTLEKDCEIAEKMGAEIVFAPSPKEVYPFSPTQVVFSLLDMDKKLCGKSRPGHFNGVVQVVSLLFNMVQPDNAYFGEKDFQQLLIIKRLTKELHFPVNIVGCPTHRENDGLAMSSRNIYLGAEEREQALVISRCLFYLKENFGSFANVNEMKSFVNEEISKCDKMRLDYFEVYNEEDLSEIEDLKNAEKPHAFMAVFAGTTRLIDNWKLK